MELGTIKEVASAHVKSLGDNVSASLFNKGLRTNLITLLCQSETVEAVGTVEVFGGTKDVIDNMGRAVLNLFCVAEVLGVDLATGIEKAVSNTKAKLAAVEGEMAEGSTAQNLEERPAKTQETSIETPCADATGAEASTEKYEGAEQPAEADIGTIEGDPRAKKIDLVSKCFGEIRLPYACGSCHDHVLMSLDPLTGDKGPHDGFVEAAGMTVIDVLNGSFESQTRCLQSSAKLPVFSGCPFAVYDHGEPLLEAESPQGGLLQLVFEGNRHRIEPHLVKHFCCLVDHNGSPDVFWLFLAFLLEVLLAPDIVVLCDGDHLLLSRKFDPVKIALKDRLHAFIRVRPYVERSL